MIRTIYIRIALLSALIGFFSCADELNDELFKKFTYLTQNGWSESTLDIKDDNTVDLPVYFGINGTSSNDKDITIQITADADTLQKYNFEKYKNQVESYYKLLPSNTYRFDASSYTIPSGEIRASAICNIDLSSLRAINIYDEYVLPLAITSSGDNVTGPSQYSKALYSLSFRNSYSGNYTCSGKLKEEGETYETEAKARKIYAISKDECYFYAGNVERDEEGKENYVIILKWDKTNNNITITPNTKNPDLNLHDMSASIDTKFTEYQTDVRKMIMQTTIKIGYKYKQKVTEDVNKDLIYDATWTNNRQVWKTDYPDINWGE